MKKIFLALLACLILIGCSGKGDDKKIDEEELIVDIKPKPKKYTCIHSFEGTAGYTYVIDFEGDHVIFTEDHVWDLKGWTYNKKNYKKLMAKDAKKLNKIAGVTVTYTADSKKKAYTTRTVIDMAEFDSVSYFKLNTFFHNPYIADYLKDWVASPDPNYHEVQLKEVFNTNSYISCE